MSQKRQALSVIIIAKNEASRIAKCIESVSFADEILVADNGSADETIAVARKHGAKTHVFATNDFSQLRNDAAKLVRGAWILYIDADEIVSEKLAQSIRTVRGDYAGYEIHRKNYYLGKEWPAEEWKLRLFRRGAFKEWFGKVHESPRIVGSVGRLEGDLLHDTHRTLSEMVTKTNEWSEIEAQLRFAANHPPVTWWRVLRVMLTAFWDSYIKQGGWRAGTVGIIESMYQGFSMFVTYAKLWELQQRQPKK